MSSDIFPVQAVGGFPTGSTVNISVYDLVKGTIITVSGTICSELGATGIFIWDAINLSDPVHGYQEYGYKMTDSITSKAGVIKCPSFFSTSRTQPVLHR